MRSRVALINLPTHTPCRASWPRAAISAFPVKTCVSATILGAARAAGVARREALRSPTCESPPPRADSAGGELVPGPLVRTPRPPPRPARPASAAAALLRVPAALPQAAELHGVAEPLWCPFTPPRIRVEPEELEREASPAPFSLLAALLAFSFALAMTVGIFFPCWWL